MITKINTLGFMKKPKETTVVVAMSGGVDSSTVAGIMKKDGYNVIGITLKLYDDIKTSKKNRQCCAGQDILDAKRVSQKLNIDHKIVCQATITAFRPQPKEKWEKILSFEIPSSTDYGDINQKEKFNPNYFVNIKKNWKKKLLALRCYKKEIRKYPHSRSYKGIELLAKNRGVQIGFEMAEAFQIIKQKVL